VVVIVDPSTFKFGYCSSESEQLERLMRRNDLTEEAAMQRIGAQIPLDAKEELADFVIDNDSYSVARTEHQVEEILARLRASNAHWVSRIAAGALVAAAIVGVFKIADRAWHSVEVKAS
jgi:dephospho-CoA kinase